VFLFLPVIIGQTYLVVMACDQGSLVGLCTQDLMQLVGDTSSTRSILVTWQTTANDGLVTKIRDSDTYTILLVISCHNNIQITRNFVMSLNSLFTRPTRTGQNYLVLSCPCRRCEHKCRQNQTALSCLDPVFNFQVFSNPQYICE